MVHDELCIMVQFHSLVYSTAQFLKVLAVGHTDLNWILSAITCTYTLASQSFDLFSNSK